MRVLEKRRSGHHGRVAASRPAQTCASTRPTLVFDPMPDQHHDRKDNDMTLTPISSSTFVDPYTSTARDYVAKGWVAPLPLPAQQKGEPPAGFTGWRNSRWVTGVDVDVWVEKA